MKKKLGVRARWDKPGSIQRLSSAHVSEVDWKEARACGAQAVRFALRGASDCMVVMRRRFDPAHGGPEQRRMGRREGKNYRIGFGVAALSRIANAEKKLPAEFFDRRAMLPTAAFRRYALPLVGPGLPGHARLRGAPVELLE